MKIRGLTVSLALGCVLAAPSIASAHINLIDPPSRYGEAYVKDAPCGHPDNPLEGEITEYMAGETITVMVEEFVGHNGHLRVAFAEHDSDIVDVMGFDDFDNFPGVLADNITDNAGVEPTFMIDVTLPDMACEDCTLQVIQVMYDGDGFQQNDLYHTCARVTLLQEEGGSSDGAMTSGGDTGDTGTADTATSGADDNADTATGAPDDGAEDADDGGDGVDDAADDSADDAGSGSSGTGNNADGGSGDDSGGCSCRTSAPTAPPALLLLLLTLPVLRRRR